MTRAASVVPNTVNDSDRTVDVIWTTGAGVRRWLPGVGAICEELSLDPKAVKLDRLNNRAPLLKDHQGYDTDCVIGVVVEGTAKVDGKVGTATVRFTKAGIDPEADKIYDKVKDGILTKLSVGYDPYEMVQTDRAVDGLPVYLVTLWEPGELSVVPMGADDSTAFRSAETNKRTQCVLMQQETTMTLIPDENKTTAGSASPGESAAVTATRAAAQARVENAKAIAAAEEEARQAAVAAERTRSGAIRALARQHGMGDTWAQNLVDAGTSVDEARAAILTDLAQRDAQFSPVGALRIGAGDDERDKWIRGNAAALLHRTGYVDLVKRAKEKMPDHPAFKDLTLDPGEFLGLTPLEMAREYLKRGRVDARGMDPMTIVGRAFTLVRGGGQTASDFAILNENVLNKVMLGGYVMQDVTWPLFCTSKDVKDFRASGQYRNGALPSLATVGENGEYPMGVIPDGAKYTIATERHGIKFGLSREAIVNDDLGAVAQAAEGFGQAANFKLEDDVFAMLLQNSGLGPTQTDAQPFFHANRANVNATGSALSVAGLDADRVVMRAQKDPSGRRFLNLRPGVLLVPDSLYGQALVINDAQYDTDKVANGRQQEPNRVRGLFTTIVGTPQLTGTRRYLFGTNLDAIVIAFLMGYGRAPRIESRDGWNVDGIEWRITHYAKAQMGDPKSALTNAGV